MKGDWSPSSNGNMNIFAFNTTKKYDRTNSVAAPNDGTFTAPVAGLYEFNFFMREKTAQGKVLAILHNSTFYYLQTLAGDQRLNGTIQLDLSVGDTVVARVVTTAPAQFSGGEASNGFTGRWVSDKVVQEI